jgi:hypothetical protein
LILILGRGNVWLDCIDRRWDGWSRAGTRYCRVICIFECLIYDSIKYVAVFDLYMVQHYITLGIGACVDLQPPRTA